MESFWGTTSGQHEDDDDDTWGMDPITPMRGEDTVVDWGMASMPGEADDWSVGAAQHQDATRYDFNRAAFNSGRVNQRNRTSEAKPSLHDNLGCIRVSLRASFLWFWY